MEAAGIEPEFQFDATHAVASHWFDDAAAIGANTVHGGGAGGRCLTLSDIRLQLVNESWNQLEEQIQLAIVRLIDMHQRESDAGAVPDSE